jgi:hypothetical protein
MAADFNDHELRVRSQHGEDGLLFHIFDRAGVTTRRYVEFGFGDGRECNTAGLNELFGWTGLLIDRDLDGVEAARAHYAGRGVQIVHDHVTAENINHLLADYDEFDLLSVDIDGMDYWVWQAIRARPRVVVIEYNASLGAHRSITVPYDPQFDRSQHPGNGIYHGAAITALATLGAGKGYRLVGGDSSGTNAFFVRDDIPFVAVSPAEAFRVQASRTRVMTPEAQWAAVSDLPFTAV